MFSVLGRSSATEKLYDENESSMDEIGSFGKPFSSQTLVKRQALDQFFWSMHLETDIVRSSK